MLRGKGGAGGTAKCTKLCGAAFSGGSVEAVGMPIRRVPRRARSALHVDDSAELLNHGNDGFAHLPALCSVRSAQPVSQPRFGNPRVKTTAADATPPLPPHNFQDPSPAAVTLSIEWALNLGNHASEKPPSAHVHGNCRSSLRSLANGSAAIQ